MTYEERCVAHYIAVRRRVAWVPKRPIAIQLVSAQAKAAVRPKFHTYEYDNEGIQDLLNQNYSFAMIADHFDIPHGAMRRYIRKRGFDLTSHRPRKQSVEDHAETVERLWLDGCSGAAIGRKIGFEESAVQKFIRRQGWTR